AGRDWPRLRRLSLQSNPLWEAGVKALGQGRGFHALKSLNLKWTMMDLSALKALLSCPWVTGLEQLELGGTFGDDDAVLLAACEALAGLRTLTLTGHNVASAGLSALLRSRKLAALQTLELPSQQACGPAKLVGGALPSLAALKIQAKTLTAKGVRALAASSLASRLRYLELQFCDLDEKAAAALAVPAFAGLQSL